jgi:excisionase family DNA binding protein/PAS domain S-box-containing protein
MFTTGEASRILGVTAQTVINWIDSGKLPAVRVGRGRRRIAVSSLGLFVRENAIPAQANAPDLWERMKVEAPAEATDLPAVIAIDGRGSVVFWNDRAEALLGWTSLERVGRSISEIPAKVPGLPVDLAELAREPGEEMRLSLNLELGRRDGASVNTETTLSWIRNAKGRSIGTVYLVEPVVESRKPESEARSKAGREAARKRT